VSFPVVDPSMARSVVRVRVRFYETDLMGIVHHSNYALYMEHARVEWLRRRGLTYAEWSARGLHLPVVDLSIRYRAPARFDDELDIDTTLTEIRAATVRFDYRIVRVGDGTVCTEASTRLARIDGDHVLRRIDDDLLAHLLRSEQSA
jgi:acyl-CoA thioester hydrolase